jgi:hypothetical protein
MNRAVRRIAAGFVVPVAALAAAGCGASAPAAPAGTTIAGPGLQTSQPPWKPEYAHLAQRLKTLGLPPSGDEKFHIHSVLSIYKNGLLVALPANIGIDKAVKLESSLHTHDSSGIIHMEASRPFRFTLGDFFNVWGVKLGPAQIGGLTGAGDDHLHFFVNGRPLTDPAAYMLRDGDSIVIGYGPPNLYDHYVKPYALQLLKEGKLGCSSTKTGKGRGCTSSSATTAHSVHTSSSTFSVNG